MAAFLFVNLIHFRFAFACKIYYLWVGESRDMLSLFSYKTEKWRVKYVGMDCKMNDFGFQYQPYCAAK